MFFCVSCFWVVNVVTDIATMSATVTIFTWLVAPSWKNQAEIGAPKISAFSA